MGVIIRCPKQIVYIVSFTAVIFTILNFMNVISNYSLINDAKSDPSTCIERGTYPIYHDAIHFAQFAISK